MAITKEFIQGKYIVKGRPKKVRQKVKSAQNIRNVLQCKSKTKLHHRCKKRTAHTPRCWIHLAQKMNLRVKNSLIPNAGKGLFTWKSPIRRGVKIGQYTGRKTTSAKLDRKYGKDVRAEYALCDNTRRFCVDANKTTDGAVRFANDARGKRNNSKLIKHHGHFYLKASKQIPINSEIYTNYGNSYWNK